MPRRSWPLRLHLLQALTFSLASASPASLHMFQRADTCASQNLDSCSSSLPDNFCCPSGSTCLALAGNTSALCCPTQGGDGCNLIQPITCDISKQDPGKYPSAPIKTNVSNVDLEKCGSDTCCPFGYSCNSTGGCQKNADQSLKPGQKSKPDTSSSQVSSHTTAPTASSTLPASSSTYSTTASATTAAAATTTTGASGSSSEPTSTSSPEQQGGQKSSGGGGASTTSIVGGVVAGCLILVIIAVLIILYIRRSNRRHDAESQRHKPPMRHNPTGSVSGTVISGPISQPGSYRTDFIRKNNTTLNNDNHSTHSSVAGLQSGSGGSGNQEKRKTRTTLFPRISIPNPFLSPNPSHAARSPGSRASVTSSTTSDDAPPRHGTVSAKLAPIRAMKASSRHTRRSEAPQLQTHHKDPSSENIDIFADPEDLEESESDDGKTTKGRGAVKKASEESLSGRSIARKPIPPPLPLPVKIPSMRFDGADGRSFRENWDSGNGSGNHYNNNSDNRLTRGTTFTELMDQADLGDVHRGQRRYVPGTTPKI